METAGLQHVGAVRGLASGHVVVQDGYGSDVTVFQGERKAFPVKLDMDGCFIWRPMDALLATNKTKAPRQDTNYVEVFNEESQMVTFSCFLKPDAVGASASQSTPSVSAFSGTAAGFPVFGGGGSSSAPQVQVSQEAFSSRVGATTSAQVNFSQALPSGETSFREIHALLQEEPNLRRACILGGVLVMAYNLLTAINIFYFFTNKTEYIVSCYLVFFGMVTCVTELHPSVGEGPHKLVQGVQDWMHEWAEGLTTLWGRGLFYLFQGSLIVVSCETISLGMLVGSYMLLLGAFCLSQSRSHHEFNTQEDYIRVQAEPRMGMAFGGRP